MPQRVTLNPVGLMLRRYQRAMQPPTGHLAAGSNVGPKVRKLVTVRDRMSLVASAIGQHDTT